MSAYDIRSENEPLFTSLNVLNLQCYFLTWIFCITLKKPNCDICGRISVTILGNTHYNFVEKSDNQR